MAMINCLRKRKINYTGSKVEIQEKPVKSKDKKFAFEKQNGFKYLKFSGTFAEDINYLLEYKMGMEKTCNGFAFVKKIKGEVFVVTRMGDIVMGRGGGAYQSIKPKFGHWTTNFRPGFVEAIKGAVQEATRVMFLVDFEPFNPKEVRSHHKCKKVLEHRRKNVFEGGNFDWLFFFDRKYIADEMMTNYNTKQVDPYLHTALLVYEKKDNIFRYHDGNFTQGKNMDPKYTLVANKYLMPYLREALGIPQFPKPPPSENGKRSKRKQQFFPVNCQTFTMVRNACTLLPLFIIERMVTLGVYADSWDSERHSQLYGMETMNWVEKGNRDGHIDYYFRHIKE